MKTNQTLNNHKEGSLSSLKNLLIRPSHKKQINGKDQRNQENSCIKSSNHKVSEVQTHQSNMKHANQSQSRVKTQQFISEAKKPRVDKTLKTKDSKQAHRLKTDVTYRRQHSQRFNLSQENNGLAELLEFHTGYHDIDEQQFNLRVRKQTQKSKFQQESAKSASVIQIDTLQNENDRTQNQQQYQFSQNKTQNKRSASKGKSSAEVKNNAKSSQSGMESIVSAKLSDDSSYILGGTVVDQSQKQKQTSFKKKPKLRSYSHEEKLKIIAQNKYQPKNQQQLRMQARYVQVQLRIINQAHQSQQLFNKLNQYQKNRRKIAQQICKKNEIKKLMNTTRNIYKFEKDSEIKKAFSLPKLKPMNQIVLQPPEFSIKSLKSEEKLVERPVQGSLTIDRIERQLKKQKIQKNQENKKKCYTEIENVQQIQNILRQKGVEFDVNALRKGLLTIKTERNLQNIKIQQSKNLVSNPRYKKFPL